MTAVENIKNEKNLHLPMPPRFGGFLGRHELVASVIRESHKMENICNCDDSEVVVTITMEEKPYQSKTK